jgi:S1-C subfamily serine protease
LIAHNERCSLVPQSRDASAARLTCSPCRRSRRGSGDTDRLGYHLGMSSGIVSVVRAVASVAALAMWATSADAQVTGNVISRVFEVRLGVETGSAFIVDYQDRQYVITADHIVRGAQGAFSIEVRSPADSKWRNLEVSVIHGPDPCMDVAVLVPKLPKLSAADPVTTGGFSFLMGQEAYFLGFPFDLHSSFGRNLAIPLIKHAYVSAIVSCSALDLKGGEDERLILLDGMNNPGFSGGPVVAPDTNRPNHPLAFIGVISAFTNERIPVDAHGQQDPGITVATNTGIIVVIPIEAAMALVRQYAAQKPPS